MFAEEIGTVARLRREMEYVPNIVGPACGARFCDLAMAVNSALFMLELFMADTDYVSVSDPYSVVTNRPDVLLQSVVSALGEFR